MPRPSTDQDGFARQSNRRPRSLRFESLESRSLLAALPLSQYAWHNSSNPLDVDDSGGQTPVTPIDALLVINYVNSLGPGPVPSTATIGPPFYDVSGDNYVTGLDALLVMNSLNSGGGSGEGLGAEPVAGLPFIDVASVLSVAQAKLAAHDAKNSIKTRYPSTAGATSKSWSTVGASNWTSGFYPGLLWQMYQATGDSAWLARATAWTAGIEGQKNNTSTHDVGFMVYNSFGQGLRLTGDPHYQEVGLQAARSLSSRYNPTVGAIRSWEGGSFKVIVDNMMNLELLFWAAKHGGTTANGGSAQDLYNMAVSHAMKTLQNHVRADGSTYHLIDFSSTTGAVLSKSNPGGKSTESTWSRGQAWAVYGFTMTFRETDDPTFLEAARRTADFFIDHLPDDFVPQADFSSTYTDLAHKDSSAAAIAASGLIELSTLETDPARSQRYWTAGVRILDSLTSAPYFSAGPDHAGLLLHGSRSYPGDNISLIYGDYYLVEATLRYTRVMQQPGPAPDLG